MTKKNLYRDVTIAYEPTTFLVKTGSDGNERRFAFFTRDENRKLNKNVKDNKKGFFSVAEGKM